MGNLKRVKRIIEKKHIVIPQKVIYKNRVANVLRTLSQIERKYNSKPRSYKRYAIEDAGSDNKYFKFLLSVPEYLEELREENKSNIPMDILIRDFLLSIYDYYKRFNRVPNLNQISSSMTNKINFDNWIDNWEKYKGEKYWKVDVKSVIGIKNDVRALVEKHNDANIEVVKGEEVEFSEI